MPGGAAWGGCRDRQILVGAIVWAGIRGLHILSAIMPSGLITGFGFGSASTHDHKLLETFLAARAHQLPGLESVGPRFGQLYLANKG